MEEALSFGQWLKRRRKALDLTQAELARRVGCAEGTVRRLEADEMRPSKQLAELLAERVDVPPADWDAFVRFARMQPGTDSLLLPHLVTAFPPLTARETQATNLPMPPTPFIGREQELAQIKHLLAAPACRLLTLIGPGGIGKTRLAVRAAGDARQAYHDGVYYAALAPVGAVEHLVPVIASALKDLSGGPASSREQLLAYLRHKELLLVLDNFEHLLDGAGLLSEILAQAPGVKLLITSRERLNLQEEWVLDVWGLKYPQGEVEDAEQYSAVQLFLQTARRVQPAISRAETEAESIVRICQLVGGMPLALELAASWARTLSAGEITREIERSLSFLAAPLRNLPERHRSMQAVFDHSWKLLTPGEQTAFRRLSVFRGGFGREAAEQVAGAGLPTLLALLDKSLVHRVAEDRYDLHALIRQFASDKLHEAGETEPVQLQHLEFFMRLAEQAEPEMRGPKSVGWLSRLERDYDNLRAALSWPLENSASAEAGLRLVGALGWFWHLRSHHAEGHAWLVRTLAAEATLAEPASRARLVSRAKALHWAGFTGAHGATGWVEGTEAIHLSQKALDLGREIGDRRSQAYALWVLACVALEERDYERAKSLTEQSLALFRELGDVPGTLHILAMPINIAVAEGDLQGQTEAARHMLVVAREAGDVDGIAFALHNLGRLALREGDYMAAEAKLSECSRLFEAVGNRLYMALSLLGRGIVRLKQGDYEQARTLLKKYLIQGRDPGLKSFLDPLYIGAGLRWLADLAAAEGREYRRPDQVLKAARLLGWVEALYETVSWEPDAYNRGEYERQVAQVRLQLAPATLAAAWAEGRSMTLEHAMAYALEDA